MISKHSLCDMSQIQTYLRQLECAEESKQLEFCVCGCTIFSYSILITSLKQFCGYLSP